MRLKQCEGCENLTEGNYCERHDKMVSKIRGCSLSRSGKRFTATNNPKEAYRLHLLGKPRKKGRND